jgi:hypothetical protein
MLHKSVSLWPTDMGSDSCRVMLPARAPPESPPLSRLDA